MAMSLSKDGNPEIYVMDLASKTFERITNHFAIDTEPNWTPDGENLIFTSDRGGRPQIYQINLDSKRIRRLTFEGDYNARPRLSIDGRYLVMVHRDDGQYHIAVQDLELDRLIIVTETSLDESPTIAPNSAMVMYATKWQGRGILSAVSLDAGIKYRLPAQAGDVREPAWSPN
jgi:TolB protein